VITGTWSDLVTMLSSELSPEDLAGGWTEELRTGWRDYAEQFRDLNLRFLPSTAAGLIDMFKHDGITSGPILAAVSEAQDGIPGVGTTTAVALAVKGAVARTRTLGFTGRTPTLRRELPDGAIHLVNFQRMNSGVTGREPSFTVNLNAVPSALRRAWAATGHSFGRNPIDSAVNVGVWGRLGMLAAGYRGPDVWWHPSTEEEAEQVAAEVFEQLRTTGLDWLHRMSDPETAIDELLDGDSLLTVHVAAAMLVERPGDERRQPAAAILRRWSPAPGNENRVLRDWLMEQLTDAAE
jgi:hypothetical protein